MLLFAHGWQPLLCSAIPDFDYSGVDTAADWIAGGWNVGIFVWSRLSDEPAVGDAKPKIWTPQGPPGMR